MIFQVGYRDILLISTQPSSFLLRLKETIEQWPKMHGYLLYVLGMNNYPVTMGLFREPWTKHPGTWANQYFVECHVKDFVEHCSIADTEKCKAALPWTELVVASCWSFSCKASLLACPISTLSTKTQRLTYIYILYIYLEPNWPLFWGVDLASYGSNLPKYESFGYMIIFITLDLPPTKDASHHQDYYIFSRELLVQPSFATGILGGG